MKRKIREKLTAFILAAGVVLSSGVIPSTEGKADGNDDELQWQELQGILSEVTGRYTQAPEKNKVESSNFTAGMLLGNGSLGVVSDAREDEQSFYFSGQDVWNGSQKVMNAQLEIVPAEKGKLEITTNESNEADGSKGAAAVIDGDPLTYWITKAQNASPGDKWLQFDFKTEVTVDEWVSIHRGYMDVNSETGEHNIRYNTREFSLQTSSDGEVWKDIDIVEENTDYIVERKLEAPVTSRYFRVNVTKAVQPGSETAYVEGDRDTARISEIDFLYQGDSLFSAKSDEQMELSFSASDTGGFNTSAENAFDSDTATLWRSENQAERIDEKNVPQDKWVQVSSTKEFSFNKIEVKHIGALYPENSCYNTYDYELQVSEDGTVWDTIQTVTGNTDNVNVFTFEEPVQAKFFRLYTSHPVADEYASKHYEKDMTNASVVDIDLYLDTENVLNPMEEGDGTYYHEQDILNAEVRSRQKFADENVSFRSWVSDSRNILYTDITLDENAGHNTKLRASLTAPSGISRKKGVSGNIIWLTRDSGSPYKSRTATAVKILDGEYEISDEDILFTLKPGETVHMAVFAHASSGLTDGSGIAPKAMDTVRNEAIEHLQEVTPEIIRKEHEEHLKWWKDYWMKSYINVDDVTLQRYYFGALYGLGCVMRPTPEGAEQPNVPGSMHGAWQTNDSCSSKGRAYLNYNYEAPYYGMYSSNRSEFMEPYYIDTSIKMTHAQNKTASAGYKGAQVERNISPYHNFYYAKSPKNVSGSKKPAQLPTDQKSNAMLYTQPLIWDWQYNRDEETLKEYIYPTVKLAVEFYMDFIEKEDDGTYWVYNSANNELNASSDYDINPILDLGYIRSHFEAFIEMSEYLGENLEMADEMREILDNLSPIPTSENAGQTKNDLAKLGFDDEKEVYVSGYYSDNYDQIKASNCPWGSYIYEGNQPVALEGVVHPAENVSLASDPKELAIARDTFEYFNPMYLYYRGGGYNGFAKSFTIAARLGIDGDRILDGLDKTIRVLWRENLTCNNGGAHGIETFGAIEAVNSMLLQNHEDELRVFPSWAESTDVKFVDLKAKGAFLVSSEYDADTQTIPYVRLTSEKGETVHFVSPWTNGITVKDAAGKEVKTEVSATKNTGELLFTFDTEKDGQYYITEQETPEDGPESIKVTADTDTVYVGETLQAAVSVQPETADAKLVKWTSSDPDTAKVDQNGCITGMKAGTVEITAASIVRPDISGSIVLQVAERKAEEIEILEGDKEIGVNGAVSLRTQVYPESAVDKEVVWSSSDPEIATVDEGGNVTGHLSGTAEITAALAADENIKDSVKVTVKVDDRGYTALVYNRDQSHQQNGSTSKQAYTMAYSFEVKSAVTVTELGIYDQNGNGVFNNTGSQVGIWSADSGELLASAEIPNGTAADEDGFCYVKLDTILELEPGRYEITAFYPKNSSDNWFHSEFERPFVTAPQIEYLLSGYSAGANEMQKPEVKEGVRPYHSMTFKFIDKSRLGAQLDVVQRLQEKDYTEDSWELLEKASAAAENTLKNSLSQNEVDAVYEELRAAVKNLREYVSRKTLEYFLNSAKDHVANGDTENLVRSVRDLFEEAITEGEAVMKDENAGREEVVNATLKLMKAIQALDFKAGDKTDLEMALELAQMINLAKYVEAGQTEYLTAKETAERVMTDGNALQEEVDSTWNALVETMDNLRLKADKSVLEELADSLKGLDLSQYTEISIQEYTAAFAKAEAVLADDTLSVDEQDKVDGAVEELKTAKEKLVLKEKIQEDSDKGDKESPGEVQENKAVKTGDDAVRDGWRSVLVACAAFLGGMILILNRKKRKYGDK